MSSSTKAVNLRTETYDVYVGRAGRGLDGYFGSPIRIGEPCPECGSVHDRGGTIACFVRWFRRRVETDPTYRRRVLALRGRRLGCFCAPKPCHAAVIARWVDAIHSGPPVHRILSGGQTGADEAGWLAANDLGIPYGGWVPRGFRSAHPGGQIPSRLLEGAEPGLIRETPSRAYSMRTLRNVEEADFTLIFHRPPLDGGSRTTWVAAKRAGKQTVAARIQLASDSRDAERPDQAIANALREELSLRCLPAMDLVLNVAGNREQKLPGITKRVRSILVTALKARAT